MKAAHERRSFSCALNSKQTDDVLHVEVQKKDGLVRFWTDPDCAEIWLRPEQVAKLAMFLIKEYPLDSLGALDG